MDSLVAAGFIKTGIAAGPLTKLFEEFDVRHGQPFAERVDPDDMLIDPWARDWDEQEFIGNRMSINKKDALAVGFDERIVKSSTSRFLHDPRGLREASAISGSNFAREPLNEKMDIAEVWIPETQTIYILPWRPESIAADFLAVQDYTGPERGPYHMLGIRLCQIMCCRFRPLRFGMIYISWLTGSLARSLDKRTA